MGLTGKLGGELGKEVPVDPLAVVSVVRKMDMVILGAKAVQRRRGSPPLSTRSLVELGILRRLSWPPSHPARGRAYARAHRLLEIAAEDRFETPGPR